MKLLKDTGSNRNLHMHDLWHTLAVRLYDQTKDLRMVEQMLGHRSLASTIRYLEHHDTEKLRAHVTGLWTPKGPVN